jgi:hypothetical protein
LLTNSSKGFSEEAICWMAFSTRKSMAFLCLLIAWLAAPATIENTLARAWSYIRLIPEKKSESVSVAQTNAWRSIRSNLERESNVINESERHSQKMDSSPRGTFANRQQTGFSSGDGRVYKR